MIIHTHGIHKLTINWPSFVSALCSCLCLFRNRPTASVAFSRGTVRISVKEITSIPCSDGLGGTKTALFSGLWKHEVLQRHRGPEDTCLRCKGLTEMLVRTQAWSTHAESLRPARYAHALILQIRWYTYSSYSRRRQAGVCMLLYTVR